MNCCRNRHQSQPFADVFITDLASITDFADVVITDLVIPH
jgi:hypothetical protein